MNILKSQYFKFFLASSVVGFMSGCGHNHSDHDGEHDHEQAEVDEHGHGHEEHDGHIKFTLEQAKSAGLEYETVAAAPFSEVVKTSGEITVGASGEAVISARCSGIVSFLNSGLVPGMSVKSGQALFSVSAKGLADADSNATGNIELEYARKEFERASELVKQKLITQSEYLKAKADYEAAKARANSVGARSANGSMVSASPIAGNITSIDVKPGQYVSVGEPLATVANTGKVQLRADLPERYLSAGPSIKTANIVLPHNGDSRINLSDYSVRVVSVGSTPDASRYYPVYLEFNNPGKSLTKGMIVECYLVCGSRDNVISVPKSALVEDQGLYYVFIQEEDDEYHRQQVEIGASDGIRTEILSGLKGGEKVVVKGAYNVKMAANTGAVPGHTHNH